MYGAKDWADPTEMYNLGFELINSLDSNVYIVPAAGYYADYLNAASSMQTGNRMYLKAVI